MTRSFFGEKHYSIFRLRCCYCLFNHCCWFGWNQFSVDMNFNGSTQQNIVGVTV